ncbi:MAG: hypothetical protein LLG16_07950 [Euryarchaeota archaeon]|nr:hypothetical protein [Euryarchaeota archaeon]
MIKITNMNMNYGKGNHMLTNMTISIMKDMMANAFWSQSRSNGKEQLPSKVEDSCRKEQHTTQAILVDRQMGWNR